MNVLDEAGAALCLQYDAFKSKRHELVRTFTGDPFQCQVSI